MVKRADQRNIEATTSLDPGITFSSTIAVPGLTIWGLLLATGLIIALALRMGRTRKPEAV